MRAARGGPERWEDYTELNNAFAREIAKWWKKGDIILVHDYHLMLLPAILRETHPVHGPSYEASHGRLDTPRAQAQGPKLRSAASQGPRGPQQFTSNAPQASEGGDRLVPAHALPVG